MSRVRKTTHGQQAASEHGYRVIYEPLREGGYQIIVPALPGIVTYGRTMEEAREMAQDAIVCHLRALVRDGEEIPRDPYTSRPPIIEELKVTV
jgi:antitoxin HicB